MEKLGTPEQLARALHIPKAALTDYLEGHSEVPQGILLRAVDLISGSYNRTSG